MEDTAIQLDMTAFYSADSALRALRTGSSLAMESADFQVDVSYLMLIVSSACLFDRIAVGVPAILDASGEKTFAPGAAPLAEALKDAGVVKVLTLTDDQRALATDDLASLSDDCCRSTADFVTGLSEKAGKSLKWWAERQLGDRVIQQHTKAEEGASDFHTEWTTALVDDVVTRISASASVGVASAWSDSVLRYVINNLIRGFIYQAAGARSGTFYLPYFIREGLFARAKDNRARARAAMALCAPVVSEDDLTQVFADSRPPTEDIPFGKAAILREVEENADYRHEAITDLINNQRHESGNKALRKRLREANSGEDAATTAKTWADTLKRDHAVWEGDELPVLLQIAPKIAALVPGVDASKVAALLAAVAPPLQSKAPLWRMLRRPIYVQKHMRYLWHRFC